MPAAEMTPGPKGRYRKIEVRTWTDQKFRNLSPMPASGQGLWLFLMTGPHTGPIPGLFRAGRAAMAEELGWETEAFDEAFREVLANGMAKADFKARLVWLPKAIKHNKPESPNVVRGWRSEFDLLPECPLKDEALLSLRAYVATIGEAYEKAFIETFGKSSPKTMPNQEQEQEQEQEEKKGSLRSPSSAAAPPTEGGGGDADANAAAAAKAASKAAANAARAVRLAEVTDDALSAYNAILAKPVGTLSPATRVGIEKKRALVARCVKVAREICKEVSGSEQITPDFWRQYFGYVAKDPFKSGQQKPGRDHEGWKPSFKYLTQPDVMTEVFEAALVADE